MEYESQLILAQELEHNGDLQAASKVYTRLLSQKSIENKHGEIFYEFACFLFRRNFYDEALQMFIKAYEYNFQCDHVLNLIDEAYYVPNIEDFKNRYKKNTSALLKKDSSINIISFDALILKLIPVSDEKFYIFDIEEQKFLGVFDLNDNAQDTTILTNANQPQTCFWHEYRVDRLKDIFRNNQSLSFYLIYDDIEEFFSYLTILSLDELIQEERLTLFFSLIDFVCFFGSKPLQLPQEVVNEPITGRFSSYLRFLRYINDEGAKENIVQPVLSFSYPLQKIEVTPWKKGKNSIILSFCIPTYQRGGRALAAVQHVLQLASSPIEVIVCDNASVDDDGSYHEIATIKDKRLKYYRNDENIGFAKNWLKTIEHAQGKYVFIISDEDLVNIEVVPKILSMLHKEKKIAALKGSMQPIDSQVENYSCSLQLDTALFQKGYEALINCAFRFNYISGAIYNRELILEHQLYIPLAQGIERHSAYPHLYLEALLCTVGNFKLLEDVVCWEGKANQTISMQVQRYKYTYSYEGRLEQHFLFSQIISEMFVRLPGLNIIQKANLYLKCCEKTAYLISRVNGKFYVEEGRNLALLLENAYYYCMAVAGLLFENIHLKDKLQIEIQRVFKDQWVV